MSIKIDDFGVWEGFAKDLVDFLEYFSGSSRRNGRFCTTFDG